MIIQLSCVHSCALSLTSLSLLLYWNVRMDIRRLPERETASWDAFVTGSNNGTIFHSQRFLSYHPKNRFINHHCMVIDKDTLIAVFPAIEHGDTIISHRGASYGGLVVKHGIGIHTVYLAVEHLAAYYRSHGFKKIIATQTPLIYFQDPHQYVDFVFSKLGFTYLKREVTAVIPITSAEPLSLFHADARRSTKKAQREGVHVRITDEYETFYTILKNNLGMRHNVTPTHTLTELLKVQKLFPQEILLFGAYVDHTMIGGVVIFVANPQTLLAFYISHDNEYQHYRPVNMLFYEILQWGYLRGFKYLDLGTFTLNMEPNWGLGRFKENHNAHGYLRDTFQVTL
jgi:hypothetical protein